MKQTGFVFLQLFSICTGFSQTLIGNITTSFSNQDYSISFSVGESVVANIDESLENSAIVGVQQPFFENLYGEASIINSIIEASPEKIMADGVSFSNIQITLFDKDFERIPWGGEIIEIFSHKGTISSISDNEDGTYTAILTSSSLPGKSMVKYEINGFEGTNHATVNFLLECAEVLDDADLPNTNLGNKFIITRNSIHSKSIVKSGSEVSLLAGESITLLPGFRVESGALFSASIYDNIDDYTNCNQNIQLAKAPMNSTKYENRFSIYPNPTISSVIAKFRMSKNSEFSIKIYNYLGQKLKEIHDGSIYSNELIEIPINLMGLTNGIYTIQIATKDWIEAKNLVITDN